MQKIYTLPIVLMLGVGFAGCSMTPPQNPRLDQARSAYVSAQNDADVSKYGGAELQKADENLRLAEGLLGDNVRRESVDHYAYLAEQHIAIAKEIAKTKAAETTIEQVSAQRDRILLEARTREAQQAQQNAEVRAQQAEQARLTAETQARQAEIAQRQAFSAAERTRLLEMQIAELQAKQTNRGLIVTLQDDVLFDSGSAQLKSGGMRHIDKLVTLLNDHPERNLLIEGHTDSVGSDQFNQELSEQRAQAVREALVSRGINFNRVQIRGYGETYPLVSNNSAVGRQQNRRVEIVISDDNGQVATR